jgi:outer membrane protein
VRRHCRKPRRLKAAYILLAVMDVPTTAQLHIVDVSNRPLPQPSGSTLPRLLGEALQQRPDLIAAVARLRASDEGIAEARSAFMPKLSVSTNIQGNLGQISVDGMPYQGVKQPQAGIFLHFDWPLYEGGLMQNRLREAQSKRAPPRIPFRKRVIRHCGKSRSPMISWIPACSNTMRPGLC